MQRLLYLLRLYWQNLSDSEKQYYQIALSLVLAKIIGVV